MSERMSMIDAAWLHMEDPTNLMQITGLLWFETQHEWDAVRALVAERFVAPYPRFAQRVVEGVTGPQWEDDPAFDLDAHLHHVALPAPGDDVAMQALVSDLMSQPLDRTKPLWSFHLVDGYRGGSALVARLHHCIADGISLARVLLSLTGDPPSDRARPRPGWIAQVGRALDPARLKRAVEMGAGVPAALAKLLGSPADPETGLKGPLGVMKRVAWSRPVPLQAVKDAGLAVGGTINDVLLTAVTGALRRQLQSVGEEPVELRAAVPVNLRPLDAPVPRALGNQFGLVFLQLPVHIEAPRDRLLVLKERMDAIKNSPEALVAFELLAALGTMPEALEHPLADYFGAKVSAVMTNVPGPRETLSLAGHDVAGLLFWVPQAGHVSLGISIFSYAGQVRVGVASDARLMPRPGGLVEAFDAELTGLMSGGAAP